jgi:probable rRNA maturation factor
MSETGQEPGAISVENEQEAVEINGEAVKLLAAYVLTAEKASSKGELAITFVDRDEMSSLNSRYRGKEGPTDVLSFSLKEDAKEAFVSPVTLLGNVVICPEIAAANATDEGRDINNEILLLVAHGILHILDYGHATEAKKAKMFERQTELLNGFVKRGATAR